jgi:uncharacterized protein DUF4350
VIERWNALSPRAKRWWTVAGVAFAILVLMTSLNALGRAPGGPSLSANSTGGDGLAAWDELLATSGHPTGQVRDDLDHATLDPSTTVIAIGQLFTRKERVALRGFVNAGGVLVVGDLEGEDALRAFGDRHAQWDPAGSVGFRLTDAPVTVRGDGFGSWAHSTGTPLTHAGARVGAVQLSYGRGSVVALADPSPVTNAWLDRSGNAWFANRIVGDDGRRVAFAEHGHGYGTTTGFAALPARWKTAFWFAAVAALIAAWGAGKRLGPADPVLDAPRPERVRYVQAVASTLARTQDREAAAAPLRERAAALRARASGTAGLSPEDVAALDAPITDDDDLVALARSVSHLQEH